VDSLIHQNGLHLFVIYDNGQDSYWRTVRKRCPDCIAVIIMRRTTRDHMKIRDHMKMRDHTIMMITTIERIDHDDI